MKFNFATLLVVVHLIVSLMMLFAPATISMLGDNSVLGLPGTTALISSVVCLILFFVVMM